MANPQLEWAITLAQQMAKLPEEIETAAVALINAKAALASLDVAIAEDALTFWMFTDKDDTPRAQKSEWEYKVAVEHLRAWDYAGALPTELVNNPMARKVNQPYLDAVKAVENAQQKYNRLVREYEGIDRILSIYKRAL